MATQNLDLEEQEQLAALKGWWKDNGNLVLGLIAAVAFSVAAWQGWNWYQRTQGQQASGLYETLWKAIRTSDAKAVRDAGGALAENYPRTLYASMGALASARFYFDRNDVKAAKAQLQWVIDRSSSDELRDIARLRLAALLLDEKAYDEALQQLEAAHGEPFAAPFAALKGDVLVAKAQVAQAKAAYKIALEKAAKGNDAFRASVQLRLDALGG
ncbi:MAG: tetratricopeptide repeat protein [Betaproteobacteria bacterium]|nr:tetratricopeptide repeat protein [Betaproteobacteria bacterium]